MPYNLWPCCLGRPLTPDSWYVRHDLLLPSVQSAMWIINAKTFCDYDSTSHFVDRLNVKPTTSYTIFCQCCPFPHQCNLVRAWVTHRAGLKVWDMRKNSCFCEDSNLFSSSPFSQGSHPLFPKGSKFETVVPQKMSVMSTFLYAGLSEPLQCLYRQWGSDILTALFVLSQCWPLFILLRASVVYWQPLV